MSTSDSVDIETGTPGEPRFLVATLVFIGLVIAVVASLGAPLITAVADHYRVSLAASQWTLTIALLSGAVATPVLGRLGSGPRRRTVVLATLAVVVAGSGLTVMSLPFALLLVGRAAQGVGLSLTPLMMATARDHLSERRSASTIALLSVASVAGIGVGYPLAGLLTDLGGIRAAYALGLGITAGALLAAALVMPAAPPRPPSRIDVRGALVLTTALLALLMVISQTDVWRHHTVIAVLVLAGSLILLAGWTVLEARTTNPLVDVRLLRHPAVATANLVMLTGGVGMYLLLSLITRYVQTPAAAGYGFGLDAFRAGLVLVPFSVLGFVAGRLAPRLRTRFGAHALLAAGATAVLAAFVLFAAGTRPPRGAGDRDEHPRVGRRFVLRGHARRHPRCHSTRGDGQRHGRQPGGPWRRLLHRQRPRRPHPRCLHDERLPSRIRLHRRRVGRSREHRRHTGHHRRAPPARVCARPLADRTTELRPMPHAPAPSAGDRGSRSTLRVRIAAPGDCISAHAWLTSLIINGADGSPDPTSFARR